MGEDACAIGRGTYLKNKQILDLFFLELSLEIWAWGRKEILAYNLFQFCFLLLGRGRLCNRKGDIYQKKSDLQKKVLGQVRPAVPREGVGFIHHSG